MTTPNLLAAVAAGVGEGGAVPTWLVTGASGFVGANFRAWLSRHRPAVRVLCAGRRRPVEVSEADFLPLDLAGATFTLPEGLQAVVHLAGEKRHDHLMERVNHAGALHLLEAAARAGAGRFVHLSSVGVYGALPHAGVVDESRACEPRNAYERSKHLGERAVRERAGALGLPCVILQPSNVVGLHGLAHRPLLGLVSAIARGRFRYLGRRDAWVNYVDVDNVSAALEAAAAGAVPPGTYIVNTPAPLRELVEAVATELGTAVPQGRLPLLPLALVARASPWCERWLGRALPVTPERLRELTNTTRYDGGALSAAAGFQYPVPPAQAVRRLAAAYRQEGLV